MWKFSHMEKCLEQSITSWVSDVKAQAHLMKDIRIKLLLRSHLRDYSSNRLSQFFSFTLSYLIISELRTMRRFPTRTHLSHTLHHFTNTCLPHGRPCSIKLNLILDSSFSCCAWLCCHTHDPNKNMRFLKLAHILPCGQFCMPKWEKVP